MSPQQSQPVKYITQTGIPGSHAAVIQTVHGDGTVDVSWIKNGSAGNSAVNNLPYVEVGGTPPATVPYAQEIALAAPTA